ncbi:MAG: AAA family ATPase [Candidatus Eisenbacteria bacterium]|nr:AAA family ATPase [Candidatus Eisenbacteria bacterium]
MRLRRLDMLNFGRFREHVVEFEPGLNVLVGPNESGKSTFLEAVATVLYVDPATTAKKTLKHERWGSPGAMRLRLEFDHDGEVWILEKDFGNGESRLSSPDGSVTVADRKEVDRRVASIVGFRAREVFESVAAVRQNELADVALPSRRKGLLPLIEARLTSAGGTTGAAGVIEGVDREISRIRVGMDRPSKRPGPLRAAIEQRRLIGSALEEARGEWEDYLEALDGLTRDRAELEETRERLKRSDRLYRRELERRESATELERVRGRLEEVEGRIREVRRLRQEHADAWAALKRGSPLKERRVEDLRAALVAAEEHLDRVRRSAPPNSARASSAARIVSWIAAAVGAGLIVGAILRVEGWPVWTGLGAVAVAVAVLGLRRAARLTEAAHALSEAEAELAQRQEALEHGLRELGVAGYSEFEELVAHQDELRLRIDVNNRLLEDLTHGDEEGFLARLEEEATGLARRVRELDRGLDAEAPPLDDEALARIRAERDEARAREQELSERVARGEGRLARAKAGEELPELEARVESAESEISRHGRRVRVLTAVRDGIAEALAATKERAATVLGPAVARLLSRLTLSRYDEIIADPDLAFRVVNPEQGAGRPDAINTEDLSSGTRDQLYLAARCALLDLLAPEGTTPLLLDDAFAGFDPERRRAAYELLDSIADDRQVILLTSELHPEAGTPAHRFPPPVRAGGIAAAPGETEDGS